MWRNKNKKRNYINKSEAEQIFIEAYGFSVRHLNSFTLRITKENGKRYDWFHTTGTLTRINGGKIAKLLNAEDIADFIK